MNSLADQYRRLAINTDIKIGMTELAKVTGVSTSQIRYWERKGYIKSEQDEHNKNHYFNILTIYRVSTIKYYLDQGYTLQMAVQKEVKQRELANIFQSFLRECIQNIKQTGDDQGEVIMGKLADDPTKEVYAQITRGQKVSIRLRNVKR